MLARWARVVRMTPRTGAYIAIKLLVLAAFHRNLSSSLKVTRFVRSFLPHETRNTTGHGFCKTTQYNCQRPYRRDIVDPVSIFAAANY